MTISSHDTVPLSYKLKKKVLAVMHCFYRNKIYFDYLLSSQKKQKIKGFWRMCSLNISRYTNRGGTSVMDGLLLIASFLRSSDWKWFSSDDSELSTFSTMKYKRLFRPKVCPIENNTNLNSIFCLIKVQKLILFFHLHFT